MIKILRVIDMYKHFLIDKNKEGFLSVYAKIINDLIDPAKNNWVEYNARGDKYWYPVQIVKYNSSDDTYDIYIYKYKNGDYVAEVEKYVSSSRLRPFDIKPATIVVNYEFANYYDKRETSKKNLNNIFTSSRASIEKINSITSVNTDYGTVDIKIGGTEYKNVHFIYLRSLSETYTDNNTKYTKDPHQYLSDSLYKLKEIYTNLKYTNFSLNFKNFINKLLEFNDKKIQYSTFKDSYLNTDNNYLKFDINFKVEEEFEPFTELSKNIQKISSSSTKTTNNTLQVIIDDYVNNSKKYEVELEQNGIKYKSHLFYELLNYINNCYLLNSSCYKSDIYNVYTAIKEKEDILKFEKFSDMISNDNTLLKTNINRINLKGSKNLPHYEIYIAADLFGDKIDESNVNKIKCTYEDYNATNNLTNIKKNPYIVEEGPLIELQKPSDKYLAKIPPIQNGGKTKKQRNKNKKQSRKQTHRIK
jgi:hypothetical protein